MFNFLSGNLFPSFEFWSFDIVSNFACLREAASAKAGISCFEFRNSFPLVNTMRHVITLLVENEFGVLTRVAGLFSGRGFNIESLCVAETLDPTVSTMTIVTRGDDQILEQVLKQLNKLIPVIKVVDLIEKEFVEREMVLVKVSATPETREEILRVVDIFRGKVIDVGAKTYTVEVTGDEKKINALLALLKPLGIKELVRTGRVAMIRGSKITTEPGA